MSPAGKNLKFGLLLFVCVFVLAVARCWQWSAKTPFFTDEVASYYFLADRDLGHVLTALKDQINPSLPLYWIAGWGWVGIFGSSELSLRIFSTLTIAVAAFFLFRLLDGIFGRRAAVISVVLTFFGSRLVLYHTCEARYYALLLAAAAFAVYATVRVVQRGASTRTLAIFFVAQVALVMSHTFGIFYSVVLVGCALLSVAVRGGNRPLLARLAWVGLLGQCSFLLWAAPFRTYSKMDADKPEIRAPAVKLAKTYWSLAPAPSIRSVKMGLQALRDAPVVPQVLSASAVVLVLGGTIFFLWRKGMRETAVTSGADDDGDRVAVRWTTLILGAGLLAVPAVLWGISQVRTGLFLDRYCIPAAIGVCILSAWMVQATSKRFTLAYVGWSLLTMVLLVQPLAETMIGPDIRQKMEGRMKDFESADFVICEDLWHAWLFDFYSAKPHYYYVLDEAAALAATNTRDAAMSYRIAAAVKRHYAPRCILTPEEAKARLTGRHFLYIDYPFQNTFDAEAWRRQGFTVRSLGDLADGGRSFPGEVFELEKTSAP